MEELHKLEVKASCIYSNDVLYENIRLALERGLEEIQPHEKHDGRAVLVGSGPTVSGFVDEIRQQQNDGCAIVAIKDAHDWLISNGIIPDYAVAVDPQEHRFNCFLKKLRGIKYMIASQCHPAMFDHLKWCNVYLWHLYITEKQDYPPDRWLITGGTTSGLRAISLFYAMGFRDFSLYGYDSCLDNGVLRVDGFKSDKEVHEVVVGHGGKRFLSTPEMMAQANEFQKVMEVMPDISIESFGNGIITAILEERRKMS